MGETSACFKFSADGSSPTLLFVSPGSLYLRTTYVTVHVHSSGRSLLTTLFFPMAARQRGRGARGAFGRGANEDASSGVHPSILKQARRSGQLNLSGRNLTDGTAIPILAWTLVLVVSHKQSDEGKFNLQAYMRVLDTC